MKCGNDEERLPQENAPEGAEKTGQDEETQPKLTLKFPELPEERRGLMGGVFYRRKLARARALQKERSGSSEEAPEEGIPLEKHDVSTMVFSGLLTIVPICLGVLLLIGFLLLLIFRAL